MHSPTTQKITKIKARAVWFNLSLWQVDFAWCSLPYFIPKQNPNCCCFEGSTVPKPHMYPLCHTAKVAMFFWRCSNWLSPASLLRLKGMLLVLPCICIPFCLHSHQLFKDLLKNFCWAAWICQAWTLKIALFFTLGLFLHTCVPIYLVYVFIYPVKYCLFIETITNISFIFSRAKARSK